MPKGRRPLPTAVKALRGNPGKREPNKREPVPIAGDPAMPKGLSAAAAQEWEAMISCLRTMGVLTPVDRAALAAYCYAFDIWMMANEEVKTFGVMLKHPVMGRKGTPEENEVIAFIQKKNPAVAIANEALKTMKSYLVEFGMTPSSRSKIHVERPPEADPFEAWAKQKAQRNAAHVAEAEKPN
jgi:P27 family predicted phage terminase small subunit